MANTHRFQLLKREHFLISFIFYDSKFNILGVSDCWSDKTRGQCPSQFSTAQSDIFNCLVLSGQQSKTQRYSVHVIYFRTKEMCSAVLLLICEYSEHVLFIVIQLYLYIMWRQADVGLSYSISFMSVNRKNVELYIFWVMHDGTLTVDLQWKRNKNKLGCKQTFYVLLFCCICV